MMRRVRVEVSVETDAPLELLEDEVRGALDNMDEVGKLGESGHRVVLRWVSVRDTPGA